MRHAYRVAMILAAAAALAAGVNAVHPRRVAWFVPREAIYPQPTREELAAAVGRDEVLAAIQQGKVVIDARPEKQYAAGHIPGSVSIPAPEAGQPIDLDKVYTYAGAEDEVILYCGGNECEDSRTVYELLKQAGFRNVRLYLGGWQDWRKAGLQVEP
jgi:rhodanese-related sulfurtransferase